MIIGVTGGIACGKSEVCRMLVEEGFFHIDADVIAHEVLNYPKVIDNIRRAFGDEVLVEFSDGRMLPDRRKLAVIVFNDHEKLTELEHITHPFITTRIHELINEAQTSVVIEAVELISSGLAEICDYVWFVRVDEETQIKRLMQTRGMSFEEAQSRLTTQKANDWDMSKIDATINSACLLTEMKEQIVALLKSYSQE